MTSTDNCFHLIDDGEDQKEEQIKELKFQVELLRGKKEHFFSLEGDIEKRSLSMMDVKNVDPADGDTSQEERRKIINGSGGVVLTSALIEKSGDVPVKEVVDMSQADKCRDENSPETSEQIGGGHENCN